MTTLPGMMLWTDAYLSDTKHLTYGEHGAYLLILMAMWRSDGHLPDDDCRLAKIIHASPAVWAKMAPTIREFLTVDGLGITQKRLLQELEKTKLKQKKRAIAAALGGLAKSLKDKERALPNGMLTASVWHATKTKNRKKEASEEGSPVDNFGPMRLSEHAISSLKGSL